jgi:hypothetical protein
LLPPGNWTPIVKRRHAAMRDLYRGETMFIFSCGPSLGDVWNESYREIVAARPVVAVKQALRLMRDITDVHAYNEIRHEDYDYHPETIRMSCSRFDERRPPHLHYPIAPARWESALFVTNDYEGADLRKGLRRPWGVGIMFELCLFLPIYFGCSRVVISGFDMNPDGKYHFYDQEGGQDSRSYGVDRDEFHYARESAAHFERWAASEGVQARLYSPRSNLKMTRLEDLDAVRAFAEG